MAVRGSRSGNDGVVSQPLKLHQNVTEYVEHLKIHPNGDFGKFLEDDVDMGYTSRFLPGVSWLANSKVGTTRKLANKIQAYKTGKPDHISYHGTMDAELSYIGAYEVTTPAGTWPAVLVRTAFKIHIGPAKVSDTMYVFYVKGVDRPARRANWSRAMSYFWRQGISSPLI